MPNTLIPIETYTLTSNSSSITFSNIPQNYTDLCIKYSLRTSAAGSRDDIKFTLNGDSTSNYNATRVFGIDGGTPASAQTSSGTPADLNIASVPGGGATATTFSNVEVYCPNYAGSSYKTLALEWVSPNDSTSAYVLGFSQVLWQVNSGVTSIKIESKAGNNFVANSTATLYGVSNGVKATGGTLTVAGGYAYHTFTSTGSFLPNQKIKGAEVLVIAGGGGSGDFYGAGGGAGGVAYANSQTFSAGNSYTAVVGSGGNGKATGTSARGDSGTNSSFSSFTAIGGGGGGGGGNTDGLSGGSGGGGSGNTKVGGSSTQTSGTNYIGYGYAGGNAGSNNGGGGGGGAGAVGGAGGAGLSFGGNGISLFSTWHSVTGTGVLSGGVYYIAGGGSASNVSPGGLGGGGAGGVSGTANTGGGGGGQTSSSTGNGGSGLIIVRYPLS